MPAEITGARLQRFGQPGALGIVKDTIFRECFWPRPDQPTAIFAEGSSGLQVQGPPTPRNIIFPPDTIFLPHARAPEVMTRDDVHFLREPSTPDLTALADDPAVTGIVSGEPGTVLLLLDKADAMDLASGRVTRAHLKDNKATAARAQADALGVAAVTDGKAGL